ncbi:hypothetical protein FLL57_09090 [Rhodopseudomonas palustris]|uniref:hypothetical protein n=1 Tax=Rhodopseudomonas palustris TaxID=1076 RepID=UPI00115F0AA3|nr:hypothetical protein [Rhodopseudomonas palustris]QDL97450.1 hypothetical protein FLL57_09090 [Rhodopseudomonas palustris]
MRLRVRKAAHFLERSGLALAGAACGTFVGAHVGTSFAALTTIGFLLAMIALGAVGFYLGIDIPPLSFHEPDEQPRGRGKIDTAEFLSAFGTFLATLAAFVSVTAVVLRLNLHSSLSWLILAGWLGGVTMQIFAGAIARLQRRHSH